MKLYGINAVTRELDVHPSYLRRWEETGLISPERATTGKTNLRLYDEETIMNSIRISLPACLMRSG
jgi:DNA-binding transcriptional MerR regulator